MSPGRPLEGRGARLHRRRGNQAQERPNLTRGPHTAGKQPEKGYRMKRFVIAAAMAAAAAGLSGCGTVGEQLNDVLDSARSGAAKQTHEALKSYCSVRGGNIVARERFVSAVNTLGPPNLLAADCDGDGKADFAPSVTTK